MNKKRKLTHEVNQTHRFVKAEGTPAEYHGVDFQMIRRETTEHGEKEGETIVTRYVDGAISFSDRTAGAFVYFYPDEIKELRRIIGLPKPRRQTKPNN